MENITRKIKTSKLYNIIFEYVKEHKVIYCLILRINALFNKKYILKKYKLMSVKEFCRKHKGRYTILEEEQPREVCIPYYYGSKECEKVETYISPEIYIAELTKVEIIGTNSILLKNGYCLFDMAANDKDKRYNLKFGSIKIIDQKNALVECKNKCRTIKEAIFLAGFASFNYYHTTVELLSRLKYIDQFEKYRGLPIIVDKVDTKVPQYYALLQTLNLYDHHIIPIEENVNYMVNKIIYPSYNSWMPINVKNRSIFTAKDFILAKSGIDYLRKTVLVETKIEAYRKIFISRKNTRNLRLVNDEKVKDIFEKNGFEIVYPEIMSFEEQVEVFSQSKYIASSSGAALTNLIYCQSNTTFICIIPKEYNFYLYSTIAKMIGLNSIYLDAEVIKKGKNISSDQYKIDLIYCNNFLKSLFL